MSLILEALKKSEQQRRLGEAPTLGSVALASRRRSPVLPILIASIVVALGAGWWLLRESPTPATNATVTQTDAARAPTTAANSKPPAQAAANPKAKPTPAPTPSAKPAAAAAGNPLASPKPAAPASDVAHPPTRANLPLGDRPGSVAALPPALPAVAGPAAPPPAAAKSKEATPTATTKPAVADAKPDAKPVGADAKSAEKAVPPAAEAAATRPATRPVQPALPSVWELTYAIRKELPEMSVTMHVYADDPTQRFVVIKGARHVEGDTLGDGVTLKQIRPDGMELDFKGTRFTYPRDGR
jgi:general secretion pathway protein B